MAGLSWCELSCTRNPTTVYGDPYSSLESEVTHRLVYEMGVVLKCAQMHR